MVLFDSFVQIKKCQNSETRKFKIFINDKSNTHYSFKVENIPNCDNILQLFQDIYVVREKRQFYLESRLYSKLVFLMRSPETLIRWSRYRVKIKED